MSSFIDPALFAENSRTAPDASDRRRVNVGSLSCECGRNLENVSVAYETWGALNEQKTNAIMVCHALSGDSHAVGWWDRMVGPGKPIDTNKFFVICSNVLGGCQGTTGPSSLITDVRSYGSQFPMITIGDMVEVQSRLLDALGIAKLWCVAGGSMGGMQALEWSTRFPGRVEHVFVTATAGAHNPMQIGINEVARQAVIRNAKWMGGDYDPLDPPSAGLAIGRMLGHISFLSAEALEVKFGRRLQNKTSVNYTFEVEFQVESYLSYQGEKFTKRFDANSLLHLTRAIDYYEFRPAAGKLPKYCVVAFTSDWLYPASQSRQIHETVLKSGGESSFHVIDLPYGHDAFLLDGEHQGAILRDLLR